jgi:hypothetical protein
MKNNYDNLKLIEDNLITKFKNKQTKMNKSFMLYPYNRNKVLESKYNEKFFDTKIKKLMIERIYYNNININQQIIDSYSKTPDLIVIHFNENNKYINFKKIPKYPIYINNTFYITPICIQQVNGFINNINDSNYLINNFINRILQILGAIISDGKFIYPVFEDTNINIGIKSLIYTDSDFRKNWNINHIPIWMTKYIPINNSGWFGIFNKIAIDYVFENYKTFVNVAELGTYYGLSTKYIANKFNNLYCFDYFENYMLANYNITEITPFELKYYFKYIKFECFHANLSFYPNIFTIKMNCFDSIDFLKFYNIHINVFYIDFLKNDKLLIKFVNKIFDYYPDCIIIGDDAVFLSSSLEYFKRKYNFVYLYSCYICSKNTTLINVDKLQNNITNEYNKLNCNDSFELQQLDHSYKMNFIINLIKHTTPFNVIINSIKKFNVNPNAQSTLINQNGNLFHFIVYNMNTNTQYYYSLYNKMNDYIPDKNIQNDMNLTPLDYILFPNNAFY